MAETKRLVVSAFFIATGIILPLFFHYISFTGPVFLPMHLPVLLGGLLLSYRAGLIIGLATPLLSSLFTGMPPLLILPIITVELALYGLISGWLYQQQGRSCLTALLGAMVIGRIGTGAVLFIAAPLLGIDIPPMVYIFGALVKGLPGIILQLLIIPMVFRPLDRAINEV